MPKPNSMERGHLYVVFTVVFPPPHFLPHETHYPKLNESLQPAGGGKRANAAAKQQQLPKGDNVEEVSLYEYDHRRYEGKHGGGGGGRRGGAKEAYHADSDS